MGLRNGGGRRGERRDMEGLLLCFCSEDAPFTYTARASTIREEKSSIFRLCLLLSFAACGLHLVVLSMWLCVCGGPYSLGVWWSFSGFFFEDKRNRRRFGGGTKVTWFFFRLFRGSISSYSSLSLSLGQNY